MLEATIYTRLKQLRLSGFISALEEQKISNSYGDMSFEDRLGFLIEQEILQRENNALQKRISSAKFKQDACVENIKSEVQRGLDKTTLKKLSQCEWVKQKRNLIITGPSGIGKSYVASALAHKACLLGNSARYYRSTLLLAELESSRVDGRYRKLISQLGKINVLIIDDFCLSAMNEAEEKDIFELIEERHNQCSTILTSQNPVNLWHGLMPNPAIADAILDRIVHGAQRLELTGKSRRKDEEHEIKLDNQKNL
jgi:DNA replication protein DnaC